MAINGSDWIFSGYNTAANLLTQNLGLSGFTPVWNTVFNGDNGSGRDGLIYGTAHDSGLYVYAHWPYVDRTNGNRQDDRGAFVYLNGRLDTSSVEASVSGVPEPSILGLMGLGLLGFVAIRRRKVQT